MSENINVTRDPRSDEVGTAQDQQFIDFARELDILCRKHNYPAYLITVCSDEEPIKNSLFSTAVATLDPDMATHLLADSMQAIQNMIRYVIPTAPGGVA